MDFGAFCELEPGLNNTTYIQANLAGAKKIFLLKKCLKLVMIINCVITEIDKEKRRVAISHRLTLENPFEILKKISCSELL